jgi:hypothetical protein
MTDFDLRYKEFSLVESFVRTHFMLPIQSFHSILAWYSSDLGWH